jgi:23S rRNA (adenine2503-C2)-methyltransferase
MDATDPLIAEQPMPLAPASAKRELIGMSLAEIQQAFTALGFPTYRARQMWHWLYVYGHTDFSRMSNFSKEMRETLEQHFTIFRPHVATEQTSVDGTRKWLFDMRDKQAVESVHIPDVVEGRGALCISSQVGCTLTCRFCHTGTQRLVRNLEPHEIIGQVLGARDALHEWTCKSQDRRINNLVLMGMGEPLFNYENVAAALKIIMDPDGVAISKRRVTLSTSGVVPFIRRCGAELNVNLAVSLHAANDELRSTIMPINRKYGIAELMDACRNYPGSSNARRITFEYVMLKGINDSDADARALMKLLRGVPAKVNLIPFNPWPGSPFECSSAEVIERFGVMLNEGGYVSPIRKTRGQDILAACGQLKSASLKLSAKEAAAIAALQQEKDAAQGLV